MIEVPGIIQTNTLENKNHAMEVSGDHISDDQDDELSENLVIEKFTIENF